MAKRRRKKKKNLGIIIALTITLLGTGLYLYSNIVTESTKIETKVHQEKPKVYLELNNLYEKEYKQKEIIYCNPNVYNSKDEAFDNTLTYMLSEESVTFETDLVYDNITYQAEKITDNDKSMIPDLKKKYSIIRNNKPIGITVFLSTKVYIANNTLDQKGYTYVVELKNN